MGQLNKIGRGLRPRSTMTLRFLQARLKHYIICWDRLNFCYSEEFTKLIGCCRFNWRRILSWHTKRSNIFDKVNSRGGYKKRAKMISSLCQNNQNNQNNPGGASGGGKTNWTKTKFCSIKGRASQGRGVILTKWRPLSFLPASRARRQVCAWAKRWRASSAHNYTECWWRNLERNGCNAKKNINTFLKRYRQFYGSPTCWLHTTILLTNYSPWICLPSIVYPYLDNILPAWYTTL